MNLEPFRYWRFLTSADLPPDRTVEDGVTRLCRWCDGPVTPPRLSWCSQECVNEYLIRSSASHIRHAVRTRDKGVCAICGLDTRELKKALQEFWASYGHTEFTKEARKAFGPWASAGWRGHLWDADHIIPVTEGGGCCGLPGFRTLCIRCHKDETAALAGRRRDARQTSKLSERRGV